MCITTIIPQYFRMLLKKFIILSDIGYKKKHVQNKPTEAYFFLVKHIYKLIEIKKNAPLCIQRVTLKVTRGKNANENIQSRIILMNEEESESVNGMRMSENELNKHENISNTYDIWGD